MFHFPSSKHLRTFSFCQIVTTLDGKYILRLITMVKRTTMKADTIVSQSAIPITHPKQRSWFLQGIRWHIHCTPFVCKLSTFSFPCLQEQSSPHNVEDVEEEDAPITCYLASVGQEEGDDTQDSRSHQPFGVHTQPGEIHGNFNTEVLANFVFG